MLATSSLGGSCTYAGRDLPSAVQRRVHISRREGDGRLPQRAWHQRLLRVVLSEGSARKYARVRRRRSDAFESGNWPGGGLLAVDWSAEGARHGGCCPRGGPTTMYRAKKRHTVVVGSS